MERSSFKFALLALVLLSTACSVTAPVSGRATDGSETFIGSATGYLDGSGDFLMSSENGISCSGGFVYLSRRDGEGVLTCTDGRSGSFTFVSTGQRGTGRGVLAEKPFIFTFGKF